MKFRSHLATYALASVAAVAAPAVLAGDAKEPVVLEGHALRGDAKAIKPKAFVQTDIPVSYEMRGTRRYVHPRLPVRAHGTGCTLASALAARLARGVPLRRAAGDAIAYVHRALELGYRPGRGRLVVLDHGWLLGSR